MSQELPIGMAVQVAGCNEPRIVRSINDDGTVVVADLDEAMQTVDRTDITLP